MRTPLIILILTLVSLTLFGQEPAESGFLLGVRPVGIGLGDVPRLYGARMNWVDRELEAVYGVNLMLWKPDKNAPPVGTIYGVELGLIAPAAENIYGFALTPGATIVGNELSGISFSGIATVSQGSISGITIGGFAVVAQRNVAGFTLAGLGAVAQGSMTGINLAGLGTVAQGNLSGFNYATLGTVTQGNLTGISIAGLGTVAQGAIMGISFGGLGLVSQGSMQGINVGGLGVVSGEEITGATLGGLAIVGKEGVTGASFTLGKIASRGPVTGFNIALYKMEAPSIAGINLGIGWTETDRTSGVTFAAYNRTRGTQSFLTIGILNHADNLSGIQIGLLNIVESNPSWSRYLPFLNARF